MTSRVLHRPRRRRPPLAEAPQTSRLPWIVGATVVFATMGWAAFNREPRDDIGRPLMPIEVEDVEPRGDGEFSRWVDACRRRLRSNAPRVRHSARAGLSVLGRALPLDHLHLLIAGVGPDGTIEEMPPAPTNPDEAEREGRWIARCLAALSSPDGMVLRGSEGALGLLGEQGLRGIVAEAEHVPEGAWLRVERIFRRQGPDAGVRVLDEGRAWPPASRSRLERLRDALARPRGVAAEAAMILEPLRGARSYGTHDEVVYALAIAEMGRESIPSLVHLLRSLDPEREYASVWAAADALALLVTEEDVPRIASLLREGRLHAVAALKNLRSDAAVEAIVTPMRAGNVEFHYTAHVVRRAGDDARFVPALVDWIARTDARSIAGSLVGPVARLLGERRALEARTHLARILREGPDAQSLLDVVVALVRLGDRDAIDRLVRVANGEHPGGEWRELRPVLAEVAGEEMFPPDDSAESDARLRRVEAFEAWLANQGDRLAFDEAARRWVVRPDR